MKVAKTRHVWTTRKTDGVEVCVGEALDPDRHVVVRVGIGPEQMSGIGAKAIPKDPVCRRMIEDAAESIARSIAEAS